MNGIEKITDRISADVQREIDAINAEAQRECQEIRARYDELEKAEYWEIVNRSAKDAKLRMERLTNMALMESKKQILALKQEMVSLAFERAVQKLAALPEDEYVELLAGFAEEAARTGGEQLIFSPTDRARVGKKICLQANKRLEANGRQGSLTMSESTRPIRGGLILTDGRIDVNYSLETLISSHKNRLMEQVSKILFD